MRKNKVAEIGVFLCFLFVLCSCGQNVEPQYKNKLKGVVIGYIPGQEYATNQANLKWEYLTHINVSFLYIHADGSMDDSAVKNSLPEIVQKAHQMGTKVLISLQSDRKKGFATAIKKPEIRSKLVKDVVAYARKNKLDGIDVDYEIYDSVCPELLLFVKELYQQKGSDLLQTCAVASWNPTSAGGYTKEWHRYFDLINIMSYDHTGGWGKEGQHASYEQAIEGVQMWTQTLEAPLSKLVLGLPFYGYSWDELAVLDEVRAIRYSQIFSLYPHADVANQDQVGRTYYNGRATIQKKCRYALDAGLAGVMIWQLFQDTAAENTSLMQVVGTEMLKQK